MLDVIRHAWYNTYAKKLLCTNCFAEFYPFMQYEKVYMMASCLALCYKNLMIYQWLLCQVCQITTQILAAPLEISSLGKSIKRAAGPCIIEKIIYQKSNSTISPTWLGLQCDWSFKLCNHESHSTLLLPCTLSQQQQHYGACQSS